MANDEPPRKKGFLDRLIGMATGTPAGEPSPPEPRVSSRPGTGPGRPGTDVFRPSPQAVATQRPRPAAPATQQLPPARPPQPQLGTGHVYPGDGLPPDEASEERLSFLDAFFAGPTSSRLFQDAKYMYKVVSDERNHQVNCVLRLASAVRELESDMDEEDLADEPVPIPALPPGPDGEPDPAVMEAVRLQEARSAKVAERQRLIQERDRAQGRADLLFRLMKQLTGKKGRTGGTGFLAPPPGEGY
ncbi:MAG: hypothetical protein VKO21_07170 [Candidatus Sericytochromatia bacterium]|nr:hypothetical protein [Candidatus Sericytochromatia bacterium]